MSVIHKKENDLFVLKTVPNLQILQDLYFLYIFRLKAEIVFGVLKLRT